MLQISHLSADYGGKPALADIGIITAKPARRWKAICRSGWLPERS